jgi:NTE family protein
MKRALVLSGGGLFGAWQAGAWRALCDRWQPDLVVGASVGALNGYAIAGGVSADALARIWLDPSMADLHNLPENIRTLMGQCRPSTERSEFGVVLTDIARLKPKIFRDGEVTWKHLAASCAIPGVLPQYRIGARWYSDGGLLNPLPLWAAAELGATSIVALHALPQLPARWLSRFAWAFQKIAGYRPALGDQIQATVIQTDGALGSLRDALRWKRENIERWLDLGYADGKNISIPDCF